jgi:hypothetical protein
MYARGVGEMIADSADVFVRVRVVELRREVFS